MSSGPAPIIRRVSRRELTQNRFVWRATGAMYLLFAIAALSLVLFQSGLSVHRLQVGIVLLLVAAFVHVRANPPAIDSLYNHLVLASAWGLSAIGMWVLQPGGSIAIGSFLCVGPLIAIRLQRRRLISAHLAAFTLFALTIAIVGQVDQATIIAMALMVPASWVLAWCCAIVLEAAETQGDELERLVRRDPLTGVGNRRLLMERLVDEIRRHEHTGQHLSLITLDLNGFKALNDTFGHAAGDELLRDVATALRTALDARDTIVRQGGDEFCVLLPETSAAHAARTANAIRAELADVEAFGVRVSTGIGIASYPVDALRGDVLLHVADERLRENKRPKAEAAAAAEIAARHGALAADVAPSAAHATHGDAHAADGTDVPRSDASSAEGHHPA